MKLDKFINGTGLLNLVLSFGILFFSGTYFMIFCKITPPITFGNYFFITVTSLFFGLLTFISIRKVENIILKLVFSAMEFFAILLYYLEFEKTYIVIFVSFLASMGVFTLAYISTKIAREEEEVSTELQDVTTELLNLKKEYLKVSQSNEQVTSELLSTQNKLLDSSTELLNTQNELLQVSTDYTSLLSKTTLLNECEVLLKESRGEVERLKEYEALWLKKLASDKLKGKSTKK
jgi:hypothetical protein